MFVHSVALALAVNGSEVARANKPNVELVQMFDAVANASCYHSTRRPIFEKRQNANVENTWFPIVDDRLSLRIFRLVSACFWYFPAEWAEQERLAYIQQNTFNPIYSFVYQSTVAQSRTEYTYIFYTVYRVSSVFRSLRISYDTFYNLFICMQSAAWE